MQFNELHSTNIVLNKGCLKPQNKKTSLSTFLIQNKVLYKNCYVFDC